MTKKHRTTYKVIDYRPRYAHKPLIHYWFDMIYTANVFKNCTCTLIYFNITCLSLNIKNSGPDKISLFVIKGNEM